MRGLHGITSSTWSSSLTRLEIRGLTQASLGIKTDPRNPYYTPGDDHDLLETSLVSLTSLKVLVLEGQEPFSPLPLDLRALPETLEALELKSFVVMDSEMRGRGRGRGAEGREEGRTRPMFRAMRAFFPNLLRLSLSHCFVVNGRSRNHPSASASALSASSSLVHSRGNPLDQEAMNELFLLGLPGLVSLRDLNLHQMDQLSNRHLDHFSSLTRLTSLSVHTLSNAKVTHAALPIMIGANPMLIGSLQGLPTMRLLQKLAWFVGDVLDESVPISCLSGLPRLYNFSVPSNLYYRIQRWQRDLEAILPPYCELDTISGA